MKILCKTISLVGILCGIFVVSETTQWDFHQNKFNVTLQMLDTKWYNKDLLRSFKVESRSYVRGIQSMDVCMRTKVVVTKLLVI